MKKLELTEEIMNDVRLAYAFNEVMCGLSNSLNILFSDERLMGEIPEDFIENCVRYLSDFSYSNYLTLGSMFGNIEKSQLDKPESASIRTTHEGDSGLNR